MDFSEENAGLEPQWNLLNFLKFLSEVLSCQDASDIDSLCHRLEHLGVDTSAAGNICKNSVILHNLEVKKVLLFDKNLKSSLKISVEMLLEYLTRKVKHFNQQDYKEILHFVSKICSCLKISQEHGIVTTSLRTTITNFLREMISILDTADGFSFMDKGPVYQVILEIIGAFKVNEFANNYIIVEISKKLKKFNSFMTKLSNDNLLVNYYEIILLYVTLLKRILSYNIEESMLNPVKHTKKETNAVVELKCCLNNMLGRFPSYIDLVVNSCITSLN